MSDLEQQLKKRVESGDLDLPMLPAVGTQVLDLTQNEDSDAKDLASLIQNDQSLASYVMKVANSAAYSSFGQIQTLQQAIAKLGMKNIGQMALTMTVGQSVFKSDPVTQEITEYLWRHSLACALWAREIARVSRINTEVVFLNGLLHQIGKPVALHTIVSLMEAPNQRSTESTNELPNRETLLAIIEQYQKVIGVNLARRWNLPESVVETINYIDDFYAAPHARLEVTTVNAARLLADISLAAKPLGGDGESLSFADALADQTVFNELNLYEEDIQALENKCESVEQLLQSLVL